MKTTTQERIIMADKYKLGLSGNRLLEFDSTVVFSGRYKGTVNQDDACKAIKMLSFKERVITANIQLDEGFQAYIVTDAVVPTIAFSQLDAGEIEKGYEKHPLLFTEKLFEFTLSKDGCLVIAGHTAVCDAKSLLRLAKSFVAFYEKSNMSIEPKDIYTFAEPKSLPVDVVSPLVNKLSSELDNKWQRVKKIYTLEEYLAAREQYIKSKACIKAQTLFIPAEKLQQYISFCENTSVDFSSLLYYCFYKSICSNVKHTKNASKMRIYADRRFFHGEADKFSVGAYNGSVCISLSSAEQKKPAIEQLKAFHLDSYRAQTSPFRVFSDEILLASVEQSLCNAAYMHLAGVNKTKMVKNFATTYGCMNKELCDCFYCNLTQRYWEELQSFENIMVQEPFKQGRAPLSLSAVEDVGGCKVSLRYNNIEISDDVAQKIINEAMSYMENTAKE